MSCAEDRRIYQTTLRLVKVVTQTQNHSHYATIRPLLPAPPSPAPRVLAVRPALAGCRAVCWPAARSSRGGRGRPSDDSDSRTTDRLGRPKQAQQQRGKADKNEHEES